jgi:hypothetical protein
MIAPADSAAQAAKPARTSACECFGRPPERALMGSVLVVAGDSIRRPFRVRIGSARGSISGLRSAVSERVDPAAPSVNRLGSGPIGGCRQRPEYAQRVTVQVRMTSNEGAALSVPRSAACVVALGRRLMSCAAPRACRTYSPSIRSEPTFEVVVEEEASRLGKVFVHFRARFRRGRQDCCGPCRWTRGRRFKSCHHCTATTTARRPQHRRAY